MISDDWPPLSFVLIGAGRVGTAVGLLLKQSGASIEGVSSRTTESTAEAAERLGSETFDYTTELPETDVVLIGAGDEGIAEVARAVAPRVGPNAHVCHFAGSLGVGALAAIEERGAHPCALHPVQACPNVEAAVKRLPGSTWGVTCADDDFEWADGFVARVFGRAVRVAEEDRPVWHSASVTVSNGIAALMSSGEGILGSIGIQDPHEVLGPLAAGTVANAMEGGGGGATLTGPVVRNERQTLTRHLEALRRIDRQLADEYVAVASLIVRAAVRSNRLDRESGELMLKAIESE